jgi:hypothetical protein
MRGIPCDRKTAACQKARLPRSVPQYGGTQQGLNAACACGVLQGYDVPPLTGQPWHPNIISSSTRPKSCSPAVKPPLLAKSPTTCKLPPWSGQAELAGTISSQKRN